MKIRTIKLIAVGFTIVCIALLGLAGGKTVPHKKPYTGMADPNALLVHYNNWKAETARAGAGHYLFLTLGWMRGISSSEFADSYGQASIDLASGSIFLEAKGLPDGDWDFWLINNRPGPGYSALPDPGDAMINAGTFTSENGEARLDAHLEPETLSGFQIDRVVVSRAGQNPVNDFALTGAPSLFERLQRKQLGRVSNSEKFAYGILPAFLSNLAPATVDADSSALEALVAKGHELFFNETFNGNGRTCGTCHRENNNFTIDPKFIATLPPNDPLFVAEFNPDLATLERPQMMRKFGLILENVDGTDDLAHKFTLRGTPHTLALSTSIKAPDPSLLIDFTTIPPFQRLGWGGDGAPGGGTLREFAIGAVMQHFTKSLNRTPGVDFRLPTDDELDAMEAFQLSTGRQEDFDLTQLKLKNSLANTGQTLFRGVDLNNPNDKKCNGCHFNAGGTAARSLKIDPTNLTCCPFGFNPSGDLRTQDDPVIAPRLAAAGLPPLPPDGGFGRVPLSDGSFGFINSAGKELHQFNLPPLVEAADTTPSFHHHLRATDGNIEDAIAFYGTAQFNSSPASNLLGIKISLNQNEINAIGAFLRDLNALENIRSSISLGMRAQQASSTTDAQNLAALAAHETQDAINDLTNGAFQSASPDIQAAVTNLNQAMAFLVSASTESDTTTRNNLINKAASQQRSARANLAAPSTLPASFQN